MTATPDILSTDSDGGFWLYPGKGNGTFAARTKIGGGGLSYNMVRGSGDFTNDGKANIIARGSGGKMYLYEGHRQGERPVRAQGPRPDLGRGHGPGHHR